MQEDEDADSTSRVPIVLGGLECGGTEQTIGACPDFQLGQVGINCRHNADVHLVCYNAPNPGALQPTCRVPAAFQNHREYNHLSPHVTCA